jgi:diguanylate cyclase (GGDEF)-like protein
VNILQEAWPIIIVSFLGLSGIVGLLALVSPKMFAVVAESGGMWIATPKTVAVVESPIDIDQFVIRNSRQFGALVLMVVCYLTLFVLGRIDPSWTPAFLLLILGFSVLLALSGLIELGTAVSKIETQLADARIDGLTGLANRRVLDDELERKFSERSRKGTCFCIAVLDIDRFKEVNDNYGHVAGDTVLTKGVAEVIRNTMQPMDLAARFGGDEFAVIYPATNLGEASTAVERIRTAIAGAQPPGEDIAVAVTVSIGVAEAADGDDVTSLFNRADNALYAAKEAGRNQSYRNDGESCERITADKSLVTSA